MEKVIFSQLAPETRLEALKAHAVGTEEMDFTRKLSEAEIDEESRRLSGLVQKLIETEAEKSEVNRQFTEDIKQTKALMTESSNVIKKGEKSVRERVYKFINYETREVGFYDASGNIVKVRPALAEELQEDIFGNGDSQNIEQQEQKLLEEPKEYTDFEEVANNEEGDPIL